MGTTKLMKLALIQATDTFKKTGIEGKNYPNELIHETALASLNRELATIVMCHLITQMI